MWFATDEFLEELAKPGSDVIDTIVAEERSPHFTALVLSDVHLDTPELKRAKRGRKSAFDDEFIKDRIEEILLDFARKGEDHGRALGLETLQGKLKGSFHFLINCGDILNAAAAAEQIGAFADGGSVPLATILDAYKVFYEGLATPALRQYQQKYEIKPGRLLSIPGNHDVYRRGSPYRPTSSPGKIVKSEPYYEKFATRLARNISPVPHLQGPRLPCVSMIKVMDRKSVESNMRGPEALAYLAFVGFDSNWEEYRHDFIENYGRIDQSQLDCIERYLIPELAKIACDAPLYLFGIIHHHLLPIENTKIQEPKRSAIRAKLQKEIKEEKERKVKDARQKEPKKDALDGITCTNPSGVCISNYVIAKNTISTTTNAAQLIQFLQKNRISIVMHGHMHNNAILDVRYHQLERGEVPLSTTVLACPSFAGGSDERGYSGIVRLGFDLALGQANVDALCIAPRQKTDSPPIRVTRPLLSASRVTAAEKRLYLALKSCLRELQPENEVARKKQEDFSAWVDEYMREFGYVPVCGKEGTSLDFLTPKRHERYNLLLLMRDSNPYTILLNRHVPLRLSQLADWDTVLVPAFKSIHDLLRHLRDDMLRQRLNMATDALEAQRVSTDMEALADLIDLEAPEHESPWETSIRFVGSKSFIKFSPTEGIPTEYEYTLVTLEPLVSDELPGTVGAGGERARKLQQGYAKLRSLMQRLPTIDPTGETSANDIPIEAIQPDGQGLRYDPAATEPRQQRKLPQGAVWFPVRRPQDEAEPYWRSCPSIVARNADVMTWVDSTIKTIAENSGGSYPPELLLGKWRGSKEPLSAEKAFPFERKAGPALDEIGRGCSTTDALRLVKYEQSFDLRDEFAYGDELQIKRVVLARSEEPDRLGRHVIEVYPADNHTQVQKPEGAPLGVLRPIQRYVLQAGLERAKKINRAILGAAGQDPWGFTRVKLPASFEGFAVTPPIVEELSSNQQEGDQKEFIVCDGNHRIVQRVWLEKKPLQAVAICGQPRHPFYAKPFSQFEWHVTAENKPLIPPDTASKYAVYNPSDKELSGLTPEAKKILEKRPEKERYRRYFRDLTTGFGYMGGQGGRLV
jgi:hypothetical protein